MTPEASSAASMALLMLAVLFSCVAMGGFSQGWALAAKSDFHQYPFSPPVELRISLGWWKATSSISMSGFPGFDMEVDSAKEFGAVCCGVFAASILAALYLVITLSMDYCSAASSARLALSKRRKFILGAATTTLLALFSIVLYLALAIGLDHQVSKNFSGQHVFARPDWAFFGGILAAVCWGLQTTLLTGTMQYDSLTYPLV